VAHSNYPDLVERAQQGDRVAFEAIVNQFQDLAVGTAFGWLGEIEAARDASQEAFLEVHRKLHQLRDPKAFPGWFRRIVLKHCDRITRRVQVNGFEQDELPANPDQNLESGYAKARERDRLRRAVDGLPPDERLLISLHYFAEATGPELAAFLELPLSTIKKRLRTARARLRGEGEALMRESGKEYRPSKDHRFGRVVAFFRALRAGDRLEVASLLAQQPDLVEAPQDWDSTLVHEGILPFANRATPLITAVERDDLAMLKVLLEAGADPDNLCGCATGESPLWAAVLLNRPDHVRVLLERGANPDIVSASGNRPLHLAAMRGREELVGLLLAAGADPNARDAGVAYRTPFAPAAAPPDAASNAGRTAAQWAELNGHSALAGLIGGNGSGAANQRQRKDEGVKWRSDAFVSTGIKALDLFAPLSRGGVVRFPFMAGVGMLVLLGELCRRFLMRPQGAAIWTGFTQPPFDLADWEADMAEFGLKDDVVVSLADLDEAAEERRAAFERGLATAETLRDSGRQVLAIILSTQGYENDVDASLMRLKAQADRGSITSIIITPFLGEGAIRETLELPYSGQIVLDRNRAKRHLYPAIDPRRSLSDLLEPNTVRGRHADIASRVASVFDDYYLRDPDLTGLDLSDDAAEPVARLARYLCQPFFITEPFTGRPGESVDIDAMLDELESLLDSG
jgi:RNA polymerase sigma factor (sigma-70 family)